MSWYLPALAGDDVIAYRAAGSCSAAGPCWPGLAGPAGPVSGAAELVAVTPTAPWRPWRARLSGRVVAAGVFAVAFAAALAVSATRGGRGPPICGCCRRHAACARRLRRGGHGAAQRLADGVGAGGAGVGGAVLPRRRRQPRASAVGAAPVPGAQPAEPLGRLRAPARPALAAPRLPARAHPAGGALLLALASRGSAAGALRPVLVVAAAGLVLAGTAARGCSHFPTSCSCSAPTAPPGSPSRATRPRERFRSRWSFPADARGLRRRRPLSAACTRLRPAAGPADARAIAPVARVFNGLPGVPTRVRMVPVGGAAATRGPGAGGRRERPIRRPGHPVSSTSGSTCIARSPISASAAAHTRRGQGCRHLLGVAGQRHHDPPGAGAGRRSRPASSRPSAAAALAMAELPADQVRAELAPVWERLRAGTLPLVRAAGAATVTAAALARYRLRPVPWGWLAVLAAGWLLFTRLLAGLPGDPGVGVALFRWAALLLGLGGAVLAAPETDPPRDLLRAAPVPRWRDPGPAPGRLAGARGGAGPGPGGAAGRHRRLDRRRPGQGDPAGLPAGHRGRVPGRQPDLGPGRRGRRHGRRGRPVHGRAGLAGLVPGPARQRPRRPPLAVQPGLDGRAQPGPGRGGAGAGGAAPAPGSACPAAAVGPARPGPASEARARP